MLSNKKIELFVSLTKKYFGTYFGIAIGIVLFVQFFQPFTIDRFNFENTFLFISGFGLIVLVVLLLSQVLFQKILLQVEKEISENAIYLPLYYSTLVIITSLAFIFYIQFVGEVDITFTTVIKVIFVCISLPVTLNVKIRFCLYQDRIKKKVQELMALQEKQRHFSEKEENKHIEIISENEADNLRLQVSEIVYARSADNYVEIGYNDTGEVKKKMVRNTLRNVEKQLMEFNNFIRTHRTSIVNIRYINKLNKNFNTFWLSLESTKETIPVSRQYLMSVKEVI